MVSLPLSLSIAISLSPILCLSLSLSLSLSHCFSLPLSLPRLPVNLSVCCPSRQPLPSSEIQIKLLSCTRWDRYCILFGLLDCNGSPFLSLSLSRPLPPPPPLPPAHTPCLCATPTILTVLLLLPLPSPPPVAVGGLLCLHLYHHHVTPGACGHREELRSCLWWV